MLIYRPPATLIWLSNTNILNYKLHSQRSSWRNQQQKQKNMKTGGHLSCIIPIKLRNNIKCTTTTTTTTTNHINNNNNNNKRLLMGFREAVFRLIMLTALSKGCAASGATGSVDPVQRPCYYNQHDDPHHSEAVADCIEFIKKSASTDDNTSRDSTASSSSSSSSSIDVTSEMVIPMPFM